MLSGGTFSKSWQPSLEVCEEVVGDIIMTIPNFSPPLVTGNLQFSLDFAEKVPMSPRCMARKSDS